MTFFRKNRFHDSIDVEPITGKLRLDFQTAVRDQDFRTIKRLCTEHNPGETYGRFAYGRNVSNKLMSVVKLAEDVAKNEKNSQGAQDMAAFLRVLALKTIAFVVSAGMLAYAQ